MANAKSDVERGQPPRLYPSMVESPELRWSFIRKVYSIISLQLLLTIAVSALVIFVHPIKHFFADTKAGFVVYIVIVFVPFIVMLVLSCFRQKHPWNYFLLGLFTVSFSLLVGLACAFTKGRVILLAAILTAALVITLTLYTFWAAKRGKDFSFLGPFLLGSLVVILLFSLIQIIFPLGRLGLMIYGCVAAIIFCGYIVYDTDNLIKRFEYDDYIWASVSLYLDIINLFMALLTFFRALDG